MDKAQDNGKKRDPVLEVYADQPLNTFRISVKKRGDFLDAEHLAISPRAAANLDPDAFLRFARDVAIAAENVRAERQQLRLFP